MTNQPQTPAVWVLAYILRFPGASPGEWAQVHKKAFTSEQDARDYLGIIKAKPESYQVCKVQVPNAPPEVAA